MKTLGIIGGMGPLATADLFKMIIELTPAKSDQEHIPILIDSNTNIPDRTTAILNGGRDPRPEMIRSAQRLQEAGADYLLMSCNTAHYFYKDIIENIHIPLLHMPRLTAEYARQMGYKKVALLATDGTIKSGVYANAFKDSGVEIITPDEEDQKSIMGFIYDGVKAGDWDYPVTGVKKALSTLSDLGAEAFILGCTELPIGFKEFNLKAPVINPTEVLARKAIEIILC